MLFAAPHFTMNKLEEIHKKKKDNFVFSPKKVGIVTMSIKCNDIHLFQKSRMIPHNDNISVNFKSPF